MYGSAASLLRLVFEAYIRGLWLAYCATDSDLARFRKDLAVTDIHDMVKRVARVLSRTGQTYDDREIVEILEYANTVALHSVLGMACVLGDSALEKDCAARTTDYVTGLERIRKTDSGRSI